MLSSLIDYTKNIGLTPETPMFQIRNIRLLTYICLTAIITSIFYAFIFVLIGDFFSALPPFLSALLFIPSLVLNKFQKHALAKYLLIINVNLAVFGVIVLYGNHYSNELFYIVTGMLGAIVFRKTRDSIASFILALIFYMLSVWYTFNNVPLLHPSEDYIFPLGVVGLMSVALIAYVFIIYIRTESNDYEKKIIESFDKLAVQKKYILESLQYASNIQKAIIGTKEKLINCFSDGFIFFILLDIVSGDFYWFGESQEFKIIVAADCTGHGVPAALLTIMGHDLLNEIVFKENITSPKDILYLLDQKIIEKLSNENVLEIQEGMDLSILAINKSQKTIHFSGAKSSIFVVNDSGLKTIKGSRYPVGSSHYTKGKLYTSHLFDYKNGDKIYLFSDGFQDQFGGPLGKKFMRKKFRELIFEINQFSMPKQKEILKEKFSKWQQSEEQTDDVLVIGLMM